MVGVLLCTELFVGVYLSLTHPPAQPEAAEALAAAGHTLPFDLCASASSKNEGSEASLCLLRVPSEGLFAETLE